MFFTLVRDTQMLLRFFLLGMFATLIYRLVKDLIRTVSAHVSSAGKTSSTSKKKQTTWDMDKTRITDADFHDLEGAANGEEHDP